MIFMQYYFICTCCYLTGTMAATALSKEFNVVAVLQDDDSYAAVMAKLTHI